MFKNKNILFLMADQLRPDVFGFAEHPVARTPHLDALAARSCSFRNAFTPSPLCGPARISFFTGTYPHTHGCTNHPNSRHRSGRVFRPQLSASVVSLLTPLQEAGYQTHGCGYFGFHAYDGERNLDEDAARMGFGSLGMTAADYRRRVGPEAARAYHMGRIDSEMWEPSYFNVEGEPCPLKDAQMWDSLCVEDTVRFIRERDTSRPFLAYCGFRAPHPPWRAPEAFHGLHDPADVPLPDYKTPPVDKPRRVMERFRYFEIQNYPESWIRKSIAAYLDFVAYLDDCVGRILAQLDAAGERDNTLIVFCSDHGENLYQYGLCEKHTLYDASVRIPLLFSLPGLIPEGVQRDELAELTDVLPTLLAGNGLSPPGFVEGRDLGPVLRGEGSVRENVKAEFYATLDPCRMIRDQRYKYIHTEEDIDELYDLNNDPEERVNLAWFPEYADQVARYREQLLADWEIPVVPPEASWCDLNERKQRQARAGKTLPFFRELPG